MVDDKTIDDLLPMRFEYNEAFKLDEAHISDFGNVHNYIMLYKGQYYVLRSDEKPPYYEMLNFGEYLKNARETKS